MKTVDKICQICLVILSMNAGVLLCLAVHPAAGQPAEQCDCMQRECGEGFTATAPAEKPIIRYGTPTRDYWTIGDYVTQFDGSRRCPRWTLELLTREILVENADRDGLSFHVDLNLPREFRASLIDYRHSGYDIGHMAPADNHRSRVDLLQATFYLQNTCPQLPAFNRGPWRSLEQHVQGLCDDPAVTGVWVVTVPLWLPENGQVTYPVIGPDNIAVPTHCGKGVLIETGDNISLRAWILPQKDCGKELETYRVATDTLETAAGLDLWNRLAELDELEAVK